MLEHQKFDVLDFANPPVIETVLSVQFETIQAMRSVHFGLFWNSVRELFPFTEDKPPISPIIEVASEPSPQAMQFHLEQLDFSLNRLWLLNSAGTELIQIQNDRFIKNWKQSADNVAYPHYEPVLKPAFEQDFKNFQAFLSNQQLGETKINQCEVTYVNHIMSGEGWNTWDEVENIFTFFTQFPDTPYPGKGEEVRFHTRFPIYGPNGEWIGRLRVDVQPALRASDKKPMYVMNLTARGMIGNGYDFLDIGRRYIVNSFKNLTTTKMHEIWEMK